MAQRRTSRTLAALLLAAVPFTAHCGTAGDQTAAWPDTYVTRLQAHALLQTLNARILANTSATLALEQWCGAHALAREAKIVARLQRGADLPATGEQRARLGVGPDTPVKYRRVQLYCGDRLLSEADNWYVPGRLTETMNRLLDETDTPFGKVVLPLAPYRRTFAATTLWSPLPDQWERQPPAATGNTALAMPAALFEHRAVLYTSGHEPIAEVRETYQRGLLAFPPPVTP